MIASGSDFEENQSDDPDLQKDPQLEDDPWAINDLGHCSHKDLFKDNQQNDTSSHDPVRDTLAINTPGIKIKHILSKPKLTSTQENIFQIFVQDVLDKHTKICKIEQCSSCNIDSKEIEKWDQKMR